MLDIEELTLPISENDECGQYLKYELIYDQIKECRREDDLQLTQGVWQTEPKKANWKEVKKLCTDALKYETKDLQIAVWLLESLLMLQGFPGLNQGILLLYSLCDKFWDSIHPLPDWENKNLIARMAPMYFLAEKVAEKILLIPITAPIDGISGVFSLSDWFTVRHNIRTKNNKGLLPKDLKKSVATTPVDFFQQLEMDINNIQENLRKLDDLLTKFSSNDSPSFRMIYSYCTDIKQINTGNLSSSKIRPPKNNPNQNNNDNVTLDTIASAEENQDTQKITEEKKENKPETPEKPSIEQAYAALKDIAAFLEQEQPQSPAATLLKIASSIGPKTFRELMEINMQNGTSIMNTISELHRMTK
ncbi:MAG: type VI secretion system protein TssA [Holosporaceae bacterium]|jgi:type VI secretion system protein ImpA|nr:type VI secretion system protein TssA [Holosporaceae bacterium]